MVNEMSRNGAGAKSLRTSFANKRPWSRLDRVPARGAAVAAWELGCRARPCNNVLRKLTGLSTEIKQRN